MRTSGFSNPFDEAATLPADQQSLLGYLPTPNTPRLKRPFLSVSQSDCRCSPAHSIADEYLSRRFHAVL
jgi:hypothetical protein